MKASDPTTPEPEVVLVKLGGSLMTDKTRPRGLREGVLERVAEELAGAMREGPQVGGPPFRVLLGHGSGSFGHAVAQQYGIASGVETAREVEGVSATQDEAALLHRHVIEALRGAGLAPYSIAPASCFVGSAGRPLPLSLEPVERALEIGLLPVVFGDVVMDREQGASILSTEKVFLGLVGDLARRCRITRSLWLGVTDGIYDDEGNTVRSLDRTSVSELDRALGGADGVDVTGGMRHRAEAALALADLGVSSMIANGRRPGLLRDFLVGYQVKGTLVESVRPAG